FERAIEMADRVVDVAGLGRQNGALNGGGRSALGQSAASLGDDSRPSALRKQRLQRCALAADRVERTGGGAARLRLHDVFFQHPVEFAALPVRTRDVLARGEQAGIEREGLLRPFDRFVVAAKVPATDRDLQDDGWGQWIAFERAMVHLEPTLEFT